MFTIARVSQRIWWSHAMAMARPMTKRRWDHPFFWVPNSLRCWESFWPIHDTPRYTDSKGFKRIQRLSWIELIEVVVGLPSIKLEQYRCGLSAEWAHPASSFHSSHRSGSHLMVLGEFTRVWNVGTQKYGHVLNEASIFWVGFKIFTSKIMKWYEMNVPWAERPLASNYPWGFEVDRCKTIWKEGANDPRNHLEMGDGN